MSEQLSSFCIWAHPTKLSASIGLVLASKGNYLNFLSTLVISLLLWSDTWWKQLRKRISAHSLRWYGWFLMVGKLWTLWLHGNRGVRLPAHISEDWEAEKWECWWAVGFHFPPFLFRMESQPMRCCCPYSSSLLSYSSPQIHSKAFPTNAQMFLNPVTLTIKRNHQTRQMSEVCMTKTFLKGSSPFPPFYS